ncbi:MAG: mechanosensitive ion channel family protein [Clostridia bacterium]|nr:mechanosensitive ion channel family protein [Clostridia bacterium]
MDKKIKKINVGKIITISLLAAITIAIYVLDYHIFGENSVFNKTISPNATISWIYNKIPALLKTIQIFTIAWILNITIRWLLKRILARTPRKATIVKLLNSFIKYLIAIVALLWILGAWGVDTATLLASAGLLTLVVGLGAQSLIADIIAGMFIVFEGEFQVGDIVIIDGWRGTVDEIGIRTTKVIDWQGNIKIVNNSQIASIINQSKELSVTTCVVAVDYRESIPRVELVIKNNIERIKKAIPEIVDGPYYKGVDSLGDSSVNLLFIATVKESDYYVVQRALNREIKLIFDENNISIPFPQVTINQPEEFENKSGKVDEKQASDFAKKQSRKSKHLEDTNK